MAVFFVAGSLIYRLLLGETPFEANTWFFEGVVVPLAEDGFFRGVPLSILLWEFSTVIGRALRYILVKTGGDPKKGV